MKHTTFFEFLFYKKEQRQMILIAVISMILQFVVFKYFYPYADFFSDSYSYLFAAFAHLSINVWPIGYSWFLAAFHTLTHVDTFVVGFQYFSLELASLYFLFAFLYFYSPGRVIRIILFVFLCFNPLFLYISNYINSDSLFAMLSICWMTSLLWLLNRPNVFHILIHAILLFLCFTVRNNAYYYPFVALCAFAISKQSLVNKLLGTCLPLALIGGFIIHTRNAAETITGTKQLSLFTGWQLANNALYMYGHISVDSNQLPDLKLREFNRLCRAFYFDRDMAGFDAFLSDYGANFFIRYSAAPLKQYFYLHYRPKDELEDIADWGKASVIYGEYGKWLIKKNPVPFIRYFILLNVKNYLLPPLEKLEVYNVGETEIYPAAQDWFDYKVPYLSAASTTIQSKILSPFPYIFFFLNVLCAVSFIWVVIKRKYILFQRCFKDFIIVSGVFLVANFCFCICATIIVMRYEFFPMIIALAFPLLVLESIDTKYRSNKKVGVIAKDQVPASLNILESN